MIVVFCLDFNSPPITVPHPLTPSEPLPMAPWVTKKYSAVLTSFQERFKDGKASTRTEIVKQVVKDITAIAEKDGVAIPPNLEKVVSPLSIVPCLYFLQENWNMVSKQP